MAYTATLVKQIVAGNVREAVFNVTADAASGAVATPVGIVDFVLISPISMSTSAGHFRINLNAASAAANGSVFVSSIASGDNFFMAVFGHG